MMSLKQHPAKKVYIAFTVIHGFRKKKLLIKQIGAEALNVQQKNAEEVIIFILSPEIALLQGGGWGPEPQDLKRIRDEFAYDDESFRKILKNKNFIKTFGTLKGEQVKTTPKGFDADSPAIDLLRYKQFILIKKFTDKEVLSSTFIKLVNETFRAMRPFLDHMTEILTTDVNGMSIV